MRSRDERSMVWCNFDGRKLGTHPSLGHRLAPGPNRWCAVRNLRGVRPSLRYLARYVRRIEAYRNPFLRREPVLTTGRSSDLPSRRHPALANRRFIGAQGRGSSFDPISKVVSGPRQLQACRSGPQVGGLPTVTRKCPDHAAAPGRSMHDYAALWFCWVALRQWWRAVPNRRQTRENFSGDTRCRHYRAPTARAV